MKILKSEGLKYRFNTPLLSSNKLSTDVFHVEHPSVGQAQACPNNNSQRSKVHHGNGIQLQSMYEFCLYHTSDIANLVTIMSVQPMIKNQSNFRSFPHKLILISRTFNFSMWVRILLQLSMLIRLGSLVYLFQPDNTISLIV